MSACKPGILLLIPLCLTAAVLLSRCFPLCRHRGSGASKVKGRSVRENTVLSFQKAARNMVDFVEFDVHVTADGEVVCFHDFEVKLGIGSEIVRLGIPALSYSQLKRRAHFLKSIISACPMHPPSLGNSLNVCRLACPARKGSKMHLSSQTHESFAGQAG